MATGSTTKGATGILDAWLAELRPRFREWRKSWYLIRTNYTAMAGLVMVIAMVTLAILAPFLAPPAPHTDPLLIPRDWNWASPIPPGAEGHILGTSNNGIDMYYGLVWGARTTLITSIFVVGTSAIIGIVLGAVAGFYGGKIDELLMRITDVFLSLPALILAMAITAVLTRSLENIMLALIIVWWPAYARLIRGQVLTVRESTYVEAARSIGAKKSRILFRHIVPNSLSPLVVSITLDLGAVCLVAAGLSFIGFGVESGYAEWGRMVSDGQLWMPPVVTLYKGVYYSAWWTWALPGMFILIFTMGFSLLGDALRDILDPRTRR
ncbi:MAG: ABC transporter permease [Methanomassiliicoccales archaeon]|nr:ABC transporter permease [Methanomassiliicoccales archaeon]